MDTIQLSHISKTYTDENSTRTVFRDLSLALPLDKITVVVGRSGCGKTTMLRLLGGEETPDSGSVEMPEEFHSTMLYPEPYLVSWTSVLNNIQLCAGAGVSPDEREKRARKMMALVHLEQVEKQTPPQLSTGMRQRLALARALVGRSQLLLMDEPFAALDFFTRAELQQQLLDVQKRVPRTIVFVTHDLNEAVLMADHLIVLHQDGTAARFDMHELSAPRDANSQEFAQVRQRVMDECMK